MQHRVDLPDRSVVIISLFSHVLFHAKPGGSTRYKCGDDRSFVYRSLTMQYRVDFPDVTVDDRSLFIEAFQCNTG